MEPLEQDGGVQALVEAMKENDRPEMASNLLELTRRVDELEAQNRALEETVRGMQKEIAALKASRFSVEHTILGAFAALQASVDSIKEQLGKVREGVTAWARDSAESVKLHGVSALDKSVSLLHVRPAMEAAQHGIQAALESVRAAVDRAEDTGFQLREAGRALKNASRAAMGKEENFTPAAQEGRFQKTLLAPIRGVKGTLNGMNEKALGAVGALEKLEQSGRESRERLTEKKSVREELRQSKREAAARALPAPDITRKPPEAAMAL